MKPDSLKTKIFLDSGDFHETEKTLEILGFLDGQTINPSFISKLAGAKRDPMNFYRESAQKISNLIPLGDISIQVVADFFTSTDFLLAWARGMYAWIPDENLRHIKLPITTAGIVVAQKALKEGIKVNMTPCFSQEQAAAVYAATLGAKKGDVLISPFVGRLDDIKQNGMDLIKNIIEMYKHGDGHVEIVTSSVRNLEHLWQTIYLGSDIVTCPFSVLKMWKELGMPLPDEGYFYSGDFHKDFERIAYKEIDLNRDWQVMNICHPLTNAGIEKFLKDWNTLFE